MTSPSLNELLEDIPRVNPSSNQYRRTALRVFSHQDGNIYVLGHPIGESLLKDVDRTRKNHLIPSGSERHYLESLIGVISNQRINYENNYIFR